jgi:RimJ/RimL family protein N-acetyltransferase
LKIHLHKNIISLERVDENNLEQLRLLRNNVLIQSLLANTGQINPEEQVTWFNSIDHRCNFYFLVFINQELKGYCLLKHVDFQKKSGEPGIFIVDEDFWGSSLGALLTISFLDYCADIFNIEYFMGNVLESNKRAIMNYELFDTMRLKSSNENEIYLKSAIPYRSMIKVNKTRLYLSKLENYERRFCSDQS